MNINVIVMFELQLIIDDDHDDDVIYIIDYENIRNKVIDQQNMLSLMFEIYRTTCLQQKGFYQERHIYKFVMIFELFCRYSVNNEM